MPTRGVEASTFCFSPSRLQSLANSWGILEEVTKKVTLNTHVTQL